MEIVTLGETMVAFTPEESGALRYVRQFGKRTAGAESNVAIGAAKLGHSCGWVSKLGADEFGEYILREVRGEGVDVSRVVRTAENPTGVMFKQFHAGGETSVFYYRKGSAASTLCPADIDEGYITSARMVHISGVTPALSPSCAETVLHVAKLAKRAGVLVAFDPNIRLKLWSQAEAKAALTPLLDLSDIVLLGESEAEVLIGEREPERIVAALRARGVRQIAVKLGAAGAVVADEREIVSAPPASAVLVDNIGAGDAFNAGFLCGILEGRTIAECGEMGNLMGAFAISANGDIEGLPNRAQFDARRKHTEMVYR